MPSTVSVRRPGSSSGSLQKRPAPTPTVTPRRSASLKKAKAKGRSSISTLTFEEPESTVFIDREMLNIDHRRGGLVRVDQDGPWSVSVAESPHDARSYCLYVKTPTHNLTLTRTAMEIIQLDHKLHDSILSSAKLPSLPLDPPSVPVAPKRKSAFLNTLSRLASPTSSKSGGRRSVVPLHSNSSSNIPSGLPTPAASPSVEQTDPFVSFTASSALLNAALPTPSATSTALASYFTTLSNLQPVRQARAWKRFVRVRTDDLESTRVERAIKRVRSDLAAHLGGTKEKDKEKKGINKLIEGFTQSEKKDREREAEGETQVDPDPHHKSEEEGEEAGEAGEEDGTEQAQAMLKKGKELPDVPEPKVEPGSEVGEGEHQQQQPSPPPPTAAVTKPIVVDLTTTPRNSEDSEPRTPSAPTSPHAVKEGTTASVAPVPVPRNTLPRSQSADPDRRMSRAYHTSSVVSGDTTEASQTETTTGDESSAAGVSVDSGKKSKSTRKKKRGDKTKKATSGQTSLNGSQKDLFSTSTSTSPSASFSGGTAGGGVSLTGSGTIKSTNTIGRKSQRKVVVDDFDMLRVLGKGCAGKVLLVRHRATADLYAMKAITKRHVLAHQELQHTLTEQAVLKRMAAGRDANANGNGNGNGGSANGGKPGTGTAMKDPFVVKLWWSFHDKENLFLIMDFHPGGDLATQLARWGRLGRDRARFYAAEIVEGVEGLHTAGVIYRDLKPENILIGADGHIVLTDFGLSKEFPRRSRDGSGSVPLTPNGGEDGGTHAPWMKDVGGTSDGHVGTGADMTTTFCGTAEYLAPEVIQALPYSYEVDWWSFGTMLYEMLTGITPFWANNHSDMYVRVLQDELQFPEERSMDQDTKSLIRGLLQRNPALRIREPRIKKHPYFSMIDWSHVYYKRYIPPYIPPIDPSNASDTQNFDDTFLDMEPVLDEFNDDNEQTDTDQEHENTDDTDRETNTTPSQSRSSSLHPGPKNDGKAEEEEESVDVFDGYSFKGRHSVLIDDDDEEGEGGEEGEEESEEGTDEEEDDEDDEDEGDEDIASSSLGDLAPPPPMAQDIAALTLGAGASTEAVEDEEDLPEPKTPEARPKTLPKEDRLDSPLATPPSATPEENAAATAEAKPRKSKELSSSEVAPPVPPSTDKPAKPPVPPKSKVVVPKPTRVPPPRRKERSGVAALDQYLSEGPDETENTEREDDEDEDWDFIEADGGEDRNGAKGTSLFARGVVDRYRLAVFRKASTPSRNGTLSASSRSVSGFSKASSDVTASPGEESPSPSIRRGRNQLTFRKTPRQFLRPKSPPPSSFSAKSAKSLSPSNSGTLTASSSIGGGMTSLPTQTASSSFLGTNTTPLSAPSLRSKESATSVGAQSYSSDTSGNGDVSHVRNQTQIHGDVFTEEPEKQKNKKLKKYKENAEKVFSLFSNSPRPSHHPS
ncbi:hypothetical protein D9757_013639 [Collybiopsis confluens]|uniref:Uncharacterized protein n=1 Tax=Collybiopsis confluens TaxID=2823264 RepID=A0A8H5G8A7_9AGAR|nr:hypothetical protein D9757_013639 [Collybiopsis confluens]